MMLRTHLIFAFFIGLLFLKYFNIENGFLFISIVLISSMVPDLDIKSSKIGRKFKLFSIILNFLFGHRGIIHSIFVPTILFLVFLSLDLELIGFGVLIGYLSHIISDGFTKNGVKIFNPVSKLRVRGFIKTGGTLEKILFFILLILSILNIKVLL